MQKKLLEPICSAMQSNVIKSFLILKKQKGYVTQNFTTYIFTTLTYKPISICKWPQAEDATKKCWSPFAPLSTANLMHATMKIARTQPDLWM